jgi:two-component sensor histidine kinase/ligand-binding sensor domain-containing protein
MTFISITTYSQQKEWTPIPFGDSLPTQILNDRAIWEKIKKPEPKLFKSSFIYQNIKAIFLNKIKPNVLPKAEFIEIPLLIKEEIKCESDLLFKDNSTTKVKYLDRAHGFFAEDIYGLEEDEFGNIYFGSESHGLGKFNGNNIKILEGDSLHSLKEVMVIFNDSKERLWIGTKKMVCYIQKNKLYCLKKKSNIQVRGIEEDYKGNIWINTIEEGALCLSGDNVLNYKEGLPSNETSSTVVENDGKIWIGSKHNSLTYIKNDSLFAFPLNHESLVTRFYLDENKIWICTFAGDFLQIRNDSLFKVKYDKLSSSRTMYGCFRNHLGLWFSVYGGGVYLLDNKGMVKQFSEKNGISENHIFSMIPDHFGNIWAGSLFKGISRLEELCFQQLVNKALDGRCSEIETFKNDIWYFFNGSKTVKFTNGNYWKVSNSGTKNIPKNRHLTDGAIVDSNEVWLANWGVGFTHLKENEFTYYKVSNDNIYNQSIFNIQIDTNQNIYGTSYSNRLYVLRKKQIYNLSNSFIIKNLKFLKTYKGKLGYVYIICNKGILILKNGFYKFIKQDNTIHLIKEVDSSIYLFGENEIQVLNNKLELLKRYKTDFFQGKKLISLEIIEKNVFMICTDKGVLEVNLSKENIQSQLYGNEYGLALLDFEYIKKIKEQVLLSGFSGIYEYLPKFKKQHKTPPILSVSNIDLNEKSFDPKLPISINQKDVLTYTFNSISWGLSNELKYKLVKNDEPENNWKNCESNSIHFENLTYGDYTLIVKSINKDGESATYTSRFYVLKYWYQTIWLKLLIALLILSSVGLYLYLKNKKTLKMQRKLESQVIEKTIELNLEKEELAKQLEDNNILLKEVHHRVKNNMQLVSSLIELQSEFATDEFSKEVLSKGNDRIKALAFAHQKLYQNNDYENINLKDYFNQITHNLLKETECEITIDIPENFSLNIERGQVLGFIINELIVNSLKYAWKNDMNQKHLSVSTVINDKTIEFIFKDNGIGFPKGFTSNNNNSLGYTLIPSFVKRQLKGKLSLYNENGALIKITFPL